MATLRAWPILLCLLLAARLSAERVQSAAEGVDDASVRRAANVNSVDPKAVFNSQNTAGAVVFILAFAVTGQAAAYVCCKAGEKIMSPPKRPPYKGPKGDLVIRRLSGEAMAEFADIDGNLEIQELVSAAAKGAIAREDEVKLMVGAETLNHSLRLHETVSSLPFPEKLEVSMLVVPGVPVSASSMSMSRIEVLDGVPERRDRCHFDREYFFVNLGDFGKRPGMRYVMTANEDRKTASNKIMWQLDLREPATVYLNFRSERHVQESGAACWLRFGGWKQDRDFAPTVSSGVPNGPYSGPVYYRRFLPKNRRAIVNLMGSNCWEGTYFVFVQIDSEAQS